MKKLFNWIKNLFIDHNKILRSKAIIISDLNSKKYSIVCGIPAKIDTYSDCMIGTIPLFELWADAQDESQVINELRLELIDLYIDFNEFNDNELGRDMRKKKKIINSYIIKKE